MERDRVEFRAERILLVEGTNDRDFFMALLKANGRAGVQVESYGGKTRLRGRIRAIADQSDFQDRCRWLGVCRDCDADPEGAERSIIDALRDAGLPSPTPGQRVAKDGLRQVQLILLPDHGSLGELEDLVWNVLAADRSNDTRCVEELVHCVGASSRAAQVQAKGRVYVYLSTFDPPDRSLGAAALSGEVVPLNSPLFAPLLDAVPRDDEEL